MSRIIRRYFCHEIDDQKQQRSQTTLSQLMFRKDQKTGIETKHSLKEDIDLRALFTRQSSTIDNSSYRFVLQ